jgi:hypothetical protein
MINDKMARLLAYVTGLVNQKLFLQNEYLVAENRILRSQLPKRLRLTDPQRSTLAEIGKRLDPMDDRLSGKSVPAKFVERPWRRFTERTAKAVFGAHRPRPPQTPAASDFDAQIWDLPQIWCSQAIRRRLNSRETFEHLNVLGCLGA